MKPSLFTLALAACLIVPAAIAQQGAPTSSADQHAASSPNPAPGQTESANPNGGSPASAVPGRVTGETPTHVQEELDKQLPQGDQVTASVADDGSLKLTGKVKSEADRAKAEQIARSASNKEVNNQIEVSASTSPK